MIMLSKIGFRVTSGQLSVTKAITHLNRGRNASCGLHSLTTVNHPENCQCVLHRLSKSRAIHTTSFSSYHPAQCQCPLHRSSFSRTTISPPGLLCSTISPISQSSSRLFSTNSKEDEEADVLSLAECLSAELIAEEEESEVDLELEDLKEQMINTGFSIIDTPNSSTVLMRRDFKNEKIEISFDVQDEAELDLDPNSMFSKLDEENTTQSENDGDDDIDLGFGINFSCTITKLDGSSHGTLHIDGVASQELQIDTLKYTSEVNVTSYNGPVFEQLDEDLQDALYDYLGDRGIDEELSYFILAYSKYKEQKEYMLWLKNMTEFVK